jgi:transcriptional regulator with XRE-family HTH domain
MKESFGVYLKKLRIKKGLKRNMAAVLLDIDSSSLSRIENGKSILNKNKLLIVSEMYNVNLEELQVLYHGNIIGQYLRDYKISLNALDVARKYVDNNKDS